MLPLSFSFPLLQSQASRVMKDSLRYTRALEGKGYVCGVSVDMYEFFCLECRGVCACDVSVHEYVWLFV